MTILWGDVELGFAVFGAWCMLAMFIGAVIVTLRTRSRRAAARRAMARQGTSAGTENRVSSP